MRWSSHGKKREDYFIFFNDTATTEIYTLSLHDALPICRRDRRQRGHPDLGGDGARARHQPAHALQYLSRDHSRDTRSEEHTSELQSRQYLVCRLLLEKKNITLRCLLVSYPSPSSKLPIL